MGHFCRGRNLVYESAITGSLSVEGVIESICVVPAKHCPTPPPMRPLYTSQHFSCSVTHWEGKRNHYQQQTHPAHMKAILQRVHSASVTVDGQLIGAISRGILVFAAVGQHDTKKEAETLATKILRMKMWDGEDGSKVYVHRVKCPWCSSYR